MNKMRVSEANEIALREAMARLLAGKPQRSKGDLNISTLAREAAVSRATANRATKVLEDFRAQIEAREPLPETPETYIERIRELQAELNERRRTDHKEIERLRQTVKMLAQHIQVLTLENKDLRQYVDSSTLRPLYRSER